MQNADQNISGTGIYGRQSESRSEHTEAVLSSARQALGNKPAYSVTWSSQTAQYFTCVMALLWELWLHGIARTRRRHLSNCGSFKHYDEPLAHLSPQLACFRCGPLIQKFFSCERTPQSVFPAVFLVAPESRDFYVLGAESNCLEPPRVTPPSFGPSVSFPLTQMAKTCYLST